MEGAGVRFANDRNSNKMDISFCHSCIPGYQIAANFAYATRARVYV